MNFQGALLDISIWSLFIFKPGICHCVVPFINRAPKLCIMYVCSKKINRYEDKFVYLKFFLGNMHFAPMMLIMETREKVTPRTACM
jgi:hypothetical protein